MLKPSPSCWLFLDCRMMTGVAPYKCPNKSACKRNAQHSKNRSCPVPYRRNKFYSDEIEGLYVLHNWDLPEECKPYGWQPAQKLFYNYDSEHNILWIGREEFGVLSHIPEEAQAHGFARSEDTPYWLNSDIENGRLIVTRYAIMRDYPPELIEAGWHPAVEIPYIMCFEFWNTELKKFELENVMKVWFSPDDPEYEGAIAQGWYPAEDI